MELKQAMEAATADLDVRPGFVGDVLAGGRRRHTRRLVALTAAVALLAGVTAGVVLTRSSSAPGTGDPRLTAATSGDLAGDERFIEGALMTWQNSVVRQPTGQVTEVTGQANVFWANTTPSGPAALVVQEVRVRDEPAVQRLVGLVAGRVLVDTEIVQDRETGVYRFGQDDSTYVALGLRQKIFWSTTPARGPDNRLRREWRQAESGPGDVAVVSAKPSERPVFVRAATAPAADDFTRETLQAKSGNHVRAVGSQSDLGWSGQRCTSDSRPELNPKSAGPLRDLQERALLDYVDGDDSAGRWTVCTWTPDMHFVVAFESWGQVHAAIYDMTGVFIAGVVGGPAVKGAPLPVRVVLPNGQGTLVADYDAYIGPERRKDVWLVPAGATTVTVRRSAVEATVPRP